MDRGFRHFAFYGDFAKRQWEAGRHAGFAAELARFGFACHTGPAPDLGPAVNVSGESDMVILEERHLSDPELKTWLADLPRPVAIFGGSDGRALHVLQLCAQLHIEVPLHVAIAGVDNNFFICEAGLPHLSSVAMDAAAIAREVVALMRRLLAAPAGQRAHPPEKITVPPRGMVTRASSDVVAADDPAVARAMLCIRNRYAEAISIAEIVRFSGVSRSTLDRRMLARLGHTALEALRAQRLAAAQALLRAGELPLQKVAEAAGLRWGTHLCRLFKAATGQSPRDWQLQQARAALLPR